MKGTLALALGTRFAAWARQYFGERDPRLFVALPPAVFIALLLFVRSPWTNYIFDEQEALLANPYVNGSELSFSDVLSRDFWGLPPERSIGSYRPIPNVIWRAIWGSHDVLQHPWYPHCMNVFLHGLNGALVARLSLSLGRDRGVAWLSGAAFVSAAVLTEAVCGVVGIADVLGAMGLLLALLALSLPLPAMALGVFFAVSFGFFSKESTLVAVPLVAWTALVAAPLMHPGRPLRGLRSAVALAAAVAAMVAYTETRRRFFPVALPSELAQPLADSEAWYRHLFHDFLRWFSQPKLPRDPINNPLVDADLPHRVSGALGVYAKGIGQSIFPWTLSGDYSYAQEPIPERLVNPASALGALLMVVPPIAAFAAWVHSMITEPASRATDGSFDLSFRRKIVGIIALVWVPVAYFPHSNIPILLPTVRAERFWYVPMIALALVVAYALSWLLSRTRGVGRASLGVVIVTAYFGFQAGKARAHALDYADDLVFWRATARAVPNSAKAHLNYGVMLGARNDLEGRLEENGIALDIAPKWPMAHVYYADTLCRLNRLEEAWPHYRRGFSLGPNDRNLVALGLQCMWDHDAVEPRRDEILALVHDHPGSWVAFLGRQIVFDGKKHGGVERQYRPRGYDEGPKEK